jgi:hypothetical protein
LAGGLNAYVYGPNPTGWVDPFGLAKKCPPCVTKKVIKNTDDVSKLSLRGRSLKSGRKKLSELGLKERLTRTGRHEFVDSNGLVRAAYDPVSQKRGGHWHKFAYPNNSKVSLNNAGRVVDRKSTSAHIPRQRNRRE